MMMFVGAVLVILGLLLGTSRSAAEGDRQNRNILRGLGLAFFSAGVFCASSWFVPWVLSASEKNIAHLGAWAIMVPSMLFFLVVLSNARKVL